MAGYSGEHTSAMVGRTNESIVLAFCHGDKAPKLDFTVPEMGQIMLLDYK